MICNQENLQAYLDDELDALAKQEMQKHLRACLSCRRELGRLKLLWLELAEPAKVIEPPELPYLRQQVIIAAVRDAAGKQRKERSSFIDTLRLAWEPLMLGVSFIPGAGLIPRLTKTVSQGWRKQDAFSISKSLWQFTRRGLAKGDKR